MLHKAGQILSQVPDGTIVLAALLLAQLFFLLFFLILVGILRRPQVRRLLGWQALLFLFSLTVFVVGVTTFSSRPVACLLCHSGKAPTGAHRNAGCYECHGERGVSGAVVRKFEELRMLIVFVGGGAKAPYGALTSVDDQACLSCHSADMARTFRRSGIKISHRGLSDGTVGCRYCHYGIAHRRGGSGSDGPAESANARGRRLAGAADMEKCGTCHNAVNQPGDCGLCHLQDFSGDETPTASSGLGHDGDWLSVHGMRDARVCGLCHAERDCTECHAEMPHADTWAYAHGDAAVKDQGSCSRCHIREQSCRDCHAVPMPHPDGWLARHSRGIEAFREERCLRCHVVRDCDLCHEWHIHPATPPKQ